MWEMLSPLKFWRAVVGQTKGDEAGSKPFSPNGFLPSPLSQCDSCSPSYRSHRISVIPPPTLLGAQCCFSNCLALHPSYYLVLRQPWVLSKSPERQRGHSLTNGHEKMWATWSGKDEHSTYGIKLLPNPELMGRLEQLWKQSIPEDGQKEKQTGFGDY